jgi:phosphatidylglycerophosphatase B
LLAAAAVALAGTFALPAIALDTQFADMVVSVTDTASTSGFPLLAVVVIGLVAMRGGVSGRRRTIEAITVLVAMSIAVILITLFNEHVVKPVMAVPRPNIVELADNGALGAEFPDADTFYEVGDKEARRSVLAALLPTIDSPELSDSVRGHWAHETGYSFPSGHSIAAATLATVTVGFALQWLSGWQRRAALTIVPLWAVGVVYSRVLLEVHRPLDVVAGAVVGVGCGLLVLATLRAVLVRIPGD